MTGGRRTLAALGSDARPEFLALWVQGLCIAARGPDPAGPEQDAGRLLGINEVALVLVTQIVSCLDGGPPAYPDEALLTALEERATHWGCVGEVRWAAQEALRRLDAAGRRGDEPA
jgi:hypothetical protein